MDRNKLNRYIVRLNACAVATREGGVDRNQLRRCLHLCETMSPPARVAWIETRKQHRKNHFP